MATNKVRESTTALAKDKKAVTSINSHPTNTKRTAISNKPRSATTSSIDKTSSTPSEEHVPNYLKPTRASRGEPPNLKSQSFWHAKKTGPHDATASSNTSERRRSFDRAPPAARLQKAFLSPGPRGRTITVRSSSSSISSKPIIEKTTKVARDGKTQTLSSRTKSNVKSSNPTLNKKPRPIGSKVAKSAENVTQTSDSEAKSELDHQETSSEKSLKVEGENIEVEVPPQDLKSDQKSCGTIDEHEHEQHHDVVDSDQSNNSAGEIEMVIIPAVPEGTKLNLAVVIENEDDHVHKPEPQTLEIENAGGVEFPQTVENMNAGGVEFPQTVENENAGGVELPQTVENENAGGMELPQTVENENAGGVELPQTVENENAGGVLSNEDSKEEKHSNVSNEIEVEIIKEAGQESNVVKVVENVVKTFNDIEEKHSPKARDEIKVGIIEEEGEESNVVKVIENVVKTLDDSEEKHSQDASDEIKVGIIKEEGEESNVVQVVENVVKTAADTKGTESESQIGSTREEGRGNVEGATAENTEKDTTKSQEGSEEKKESPEVIEETTIKLIEQRTNRVKALVGAFQTGMTYESESAFK